MSPHFCVPLRIQTPSSQSPVARPSVQPVPPRLQPPYPHARPVPAPPVDSDREAPALPPTPDGGPRSPALPPAFPAWPVVPVGSALEGPGRPAISSQLRGARPVGASAGIGRNRRGGGAPVARLRKALHTAFTRERTASSRFWANACRERAYGQRPESGVDEGRAGVQTSGLPIGQCEESDLRLCRGLPSGCPWTSLALRHVLLCGPSGSRAPAPSVCHAPHCAPIAPPRPRPLHARVVERGRPRRLHGTNLGLLLPVGHRESARVERDPPSLTRWLALPPCGRRGPDRELRRGPQGGQGVRERLTCR